MSSELSCDHSHRYGMTIPPCSGNGKCISGLCYCHAGWSGRADYQVDPHYDCDIHLNGVRIESSVLSFACVVLIIASLNTLRKMKFKYSDIGSDPKVSLLICYVLNGIGDCLYALTKTIDPYVFFVGSGNYLTAIGSSMFISFCGLGYSKMVSSEYRDLIAKRCKLVNDYIFFTMVLPVTFSVLDLLSASNPHKADYFAIGTLLSMICMMICYIVSSHVTITAFVSEIGKYLSTVENDKSAQLDQVRSIHSHIKIASNLIVVFYVFAISVGTILSSIAYLRRKITYVQVFLRLFVTIVEIIISFLIAPGNRSSSSKKGSSNKSNDTPKNVNMVKVYVSENINYNNNSQLNSPVNRTEVKSDNEHKSSITYV